MGSDFHWHADGCTNNEGVDKNGRCRKCRSAYNNTNRRRHPKLFEPTSIVTPSMSLVLPSNEKLCSVIKERLEVIQKSDINTDSVLKQAARLLMANNCDGIECGKHKMFMVCRDCKSHRVCRKQSNNGSLCTKCKNKSTVKDWQLERRVKNQAQRVSPHSSTPLSALSTEELKVRSKALKMQRRSKAAMIKILKEKIESYKVECEMSEELLNHMNEALECASTNKAQFQHDIKSTLVELLTEEAKKNGVVGEDALLSHEDTQQFVDFLTESMRNHIRKVEGNKTLYRFSPYLMGLAMNQYLQSGSSKYDQWQDDNVIVMPSSVNLVKKKQSQKIRVGDCVVMYEKQLLIREWAEEIGELMCDEMKLKEDILFNSITNKMVGFTEDFICKRKIITNLLDEDKVDNFCEPAKYVNQWRYRSVKGRSFNCEFWFNGGSLDGNALVEQFVQVVLHCEIIGARVFGFVYDAGGYNARMMKLLRGNNSLPEGGWIPLDSVRTRNPYDPNRWICLFHCSTHDLKAMRNQLYTSWVKNGKKQFLDENNMPIGKAIIEECFERDRQREMRNFASKSEVRESTVILNKWSKMNVAEAKRVFSWKTLVEILSNLYQELDVSRKDHLSMEEHGPLGYMPSAAKHLHSILVKRDAETKSRLGPKVSSFEFLANVHEMFNATLMNTDLMIDRDNIDRSVMLSDI